MTLSNSARRKPLTRNEMRAIFSALQYCRDRKDYNYPMGAHNRAMDKIIEQMMQERRDGIKAKAARDARKGSREPRYDGGNLGSLESMTYHHAYEQQQRRDHRS